MKHKLLKTLPYMPYITGIILTCLIPFIPDRILVAVVACANIGVLVRWLSKEINERIRGRQVAGFLVELLNNVTQRADKPEKEHKVVN